MKKTVINEIIHYLSNFNKIYNSNIIFNIISFITVTAIITIVIDKTIFLAFIIIITSWPYLSKLLNLFDLRLCEILIHGKGASSFFRVNILISCDRFFFL